MQSSERRLSLASRAHISYSVPTVSESGQGSPDVCAYCGSVATTVDHVPPKGLYTEERRRGLNLVTVPACKECNEQTAKDEEYFRNVMASSTAVETAAGRELFQNEVTRSLQHSPGLLKRIASQFATKEIRSPGGIYLTTLPAIKLESNRFERVLIKIARGLYFLHRGTRVPSTLDAQAFHVTHLLEELTMLQSLQVCAADPDVFKYRVAFAQDGPTVIIIMCFLGTESFMVAFARPNH